MTEQNLSTEEFKHIDINLKNHHNHLHNKFFKNRKIGVDPEDIVEELFENTSEQEQVNYLYSAIIDGNQRVVDAIIECGNPDIFTEEIIEKIFYAVIDIAANQEPEKKKLLEKYAANFSEAAGIDLHIHHAETSE